jgi:adenylate cyclase
MKPRDWAATIIVSCLVAWLFSLPTFDRLHGLGIDSLFWLREQVFVSPSPVNSPTVVIAVDEETYRQPPFKDTPYAMWTPYMADVIDALDEANASVIGLDIIFPTSVQSLLPGYDRSFLIALRRASQQDRIVLAKFQSTLKATAPFPGYEFAVGGDNIRATNLLTDPDDVVRRFPLFLIGVDGGHEYHESTLPLEMAMRVLRQKAAVQDHEAQLGGRAIPSDDRFGAYVNFRGGNPIPTYSLADIHACLKAGRSDFIAEHFRGKAVLIGAVLDVEDRKLTSRRYIVGPEGSYKTPRCVLPVLAGMHDEALYRRNTPGVYIHAQAVNDLVRGDTLSDSNRFTGAAIIVGACMLAGVFAFAVQPYLTALLVVALALAWVAIAIVAFRFGLILPLFDPPLGGTIAAATLIAYRFRLVDQNQRRLRQAFSYYLPASLLEKMISSPSPPKLGGEEREITVWFSDLANFTGSSEGKPAQAVVARLNDYFDNVVAVIERHGGYVDKFVGDGIVAFFGAPLALDNQAAAAIAAAREIAEHLRQLAPDGSFATRIGIHTGMAVIGNIGSSRRFNYTAIGDSVNIASRLEGANRAFGTHILVSESTRLLAREEAGLIELGRIRIVGRIEPIRVYTFPTTILTAEDREFLAAARHLMAERKFADAANLLRPLSAREPAVSALREWAEKYTTEPPLSDWDGVIEMTSK